jgi:hypothetical protein
MRIVRKLFLLALMTMTATALAASTATGEPEPLEILNEHTLAHCPDVLNATTGGCKVHLRGEIRLGGHIFGIEANASENYVELEARIDENGEGYVYMATVTASGPAPYDVVNHSDTREPCGLPWRIHGEEDDPRGSGETIHFENCLDPDNPANPDGDENRCLFEAPIVETAPAGSHDYEIPLIDYGGVNHTGPDCEFNGELHIEQNPLNGTYDEIEIVH